MKIAIRKRGTVSDVYIDDRLVSHGCMGWEVASSGGGFAELTIHFVAKEADIDFEVDDPLSKAQEAQGANEPHRLSRPNLPKR